LYFAKYGKKSAWNTWLACPEITDTFALLSSPLQNSPPENAIQKLEHFVVIMYSRTSDDVDVNTARMTLFDNIPPTRAALEEHIKRATYQAGHIWGQTLQLQPLVPSPSDWGWEIAEKACLELTSCNCTKSCKGNALHRIRKVHFFTQYRQLLCLMHLQAKSNIG
jgi:hypothetical protein